MIVSHAVFIWFCTVMTAGVAGTWLFFELARLRNVLRLDRSRATVRDQVFGSLIGIAVCVVGVAGMVLYHL